MPKITVNGTAQDCAAATIPDLLKSQQVPEAHWQSLAVACNGRVIRKAEWAATPLADGDAVEIVKPFVGG